MQKKFIGKVIVDVLMIVLLLLLMSYSLIGEAVHEWLGAAIFLLFVLHHMLNWEWMKRLGKGRYAAFRILQTGLAAGIFLTMLGSMSSGIVLSRYVFDFLPIQGGHTLARTLHLPCAYWSFVLMSLHFGLHWGMMMGVLRRLTRKTALSHICTRILRLLAILIAIYGGIAFFHHDILSYLLLQTHFVFFDFDRPLILFFIDYLAIMGLFTFLAYYMGKHMQKHKE